MEFRAAIEGIRHALNLFTFHRIIHLTDSTLVEQALMGSSRLNHRRHQVITDCIQYMQGHKGNKILTYQVPRRFNCGADRLCNISMDLCIDVDESCTSTESNELLNLLLDDGQNTYGLVSTCIAPRIPNMIELERVVWRTQRSAVFEELRFKHGTTPFQWTATCKPPRGNIRSLPPTCTSPSGFETHDNSFLVDGKKRTVPQTVYDKLQKVCLKHNISWDTSAFVLPSDPTKEPKCDIRIMSEICTAVNNDVAYVIRLLRGQTDADNRPSKHLRPELYNEHLKDYPGLKDLCDIASNGFTSRITDFTPPRPFHDNHQSAKERAPAVQRRLFKESNLRRTLLLYSDVAALDPGVNSCPFAVAPKKNVDYQTDGRLIHNASYPQGSSINEAVPNEKLDAKTDDVIDLARRAIHLFQEYPETEIFAMCADVDCGFHNAPASEQSAILFGGQLPGSNIVSIALTAIFGYKDSPAIFALLAKAAQHYHRTTPGGRAYWNWLWVDDFVCIEPNVGTLLHDSESRLRASFQLVFGSPGWNDAKYVPWTNLIHAVGLDWNFSDGTVTIPALKIIKTMDKIATCMKSCVDKRPPTLHEWRSLVGTLRHVSSCIPGARPFFQRFVSTEKLLAAKQLPDWSELTNDLRWFTKVFSSTHLNGITLERFASVSDRVGLIYMGWTSKHSYLVDFDTETVISQPAPGPTAAATLLEWYICSTKLTPNAFGPHRRTDTLIHVSCRTNYHARKLNNWGLPGHSLRTLGWHCVQQHLQLCFSGPILGSINLKTNTNILLQVLQTGTTKPQVNTFCPSWNNVPNLCNEPVSARQVGPLTKASLPHGPTFALSLEQSLIGFKNAARRAKTERSRSLPPIVATDMELEKQLPRKHFAASACKQSRHTTKNNSSVKSMKACAWRWHWKGTNVPTPPSESKDYHLVYPSLKNWESSYLLREIQNPLSFGGTPSLHSSPWPAQGKSLALGNPMQITSYDGVTSPMESETPGRNVPTSKLSGSTSTLNRLKETDTRKESQLEWEQHTTASSAQSEQCGIFNLEENDWAFKTPTTVLSPIPELDPFPSAPLRTYSNVLQKSKVSTPPVSQAIPFVLEEPLSSWLPDLMEPLSNSWGDGCRTPIGVYLRLNPALAGNIAAKILCR